MKPNTLLVSALLCFQSLGCSDGTCGAKQVRVDGSCVEYDTYVATARGTASAGTSASGASGSGAGLSGAHSGGASSDVHSGGASSGAPSGGASAAEGGASNQDVEFGSSCAAHTDCGGETDYCATPPTEPFYCTASGCDAKPELCPEGFQCFDLGQFVPGEPFICLKLPPAM